MYPPFTQALRKSNSNKTDELKDKNLANFASKLTYNESILERRGLSVLGKREESESDLIANFYQECGIEEFSRNRSESVSKQFGLRGKGNDEWMFHYDEKPRKRDLLRKYDPESGELFASERNSRSMATSTSSPPASSVPATASTSPPSRPHSAEASCQRYSPQNKPSTTISMISSPTRNFRRE
jgi:hypothetical protein